MQIHIDQNIGQNGEPDKAELITPTHQKPYWKATHQITHIFGSEVNAAPIEAIGTTREQALERLQEKKRQFNESLWI